MTPENQRIAIARACDYRPDPETGLWYMLGDTHLAGFNWGKQRIEPLPDYLNDLNAMHEALKLVEYGKQREFMGHLHSTYEGVSPLGDRMLTLDAFIYVLPEPWRLAQASLKTLGLWTED